MPEWRDASGGPSHADADRRHLMQATPQYSTCRHRAPRVDAVEPELAHSMHADRAIADADLAPPGNLNRSAGPVPTNNLVCSPPDAPHYLLRYHDVRLHVATVTTHAAPGSRVRGIIYVSHTTTAPTARTASSAGGTDMSSSLQGEPGLIMDPHGAYAALPANPPPAMLVRNPNEAANARMDNDPDDALYAHVVNQMDPPPYVNANGETVDAMYPSVVVHGEVTRRKKNPNYRVGDPIAPDERITERVSAQHPPDLLPTRGPGGAAPPAATGYQTYGATAQPAAPTGVLASTMPSSEDSVRASQDGGHVAAIPVGFQDDAAAMGRPPNTSHHERSTRIQFQGPFPGMSPFEHSAMQSTTQTPAHWTGRQTQGRASWGDRSAMRHASAHRNHHGAHNRNMHRDGRARRSHGGILQPPLLGRRRGPRNAPFVFAAEDIVTPVVADIGKPKLVSTGTKDDDRRSRHGASASPTSITTEVGTVHADGLIDPAPHRYTSPRRSRRRVTTIVPFSFTVPDNMPESVSFLEDAKPDCRVDVRLRIVAELHIDLHSVQRSARNGVSSLGKRKRVVVMADNFVKVLPRCTPLPFYAFAPRYDERKEEGETVFGGARVGAAAGGVGYGTRADASPSSGLARRLSTGQVRTSGGPAPHAPRSSVDGGAGPGSVADPTCRRRSSLGRAPTRSSGGISSLLFPRGLLSNKSHADAASPRYSVDLAATPVSGDLRIPSTSTASSTDTDGSPNQSLTDTPAPGSEQTDTPRNTQPIGTDAGYEQLPRPAIAVTAVCSRDRSEHENDIARLVRKLSTGALSFFSADSSPAQDDEDDHRATPMVPTLHPPSRLPTISLHTYAGISPVRIGTPFAVRLRIHVPGATGTVVPFRVSLVQDVRFGGDATVMPADQKDGPYPARRQRLWGGRERRDGPVSGELCTECDSAEDERRGHVRCRRMISTDDTVVLGEDSAAVLAITFRPTRDQAFYASTIAGPLSIEHYVSAAVVLDGSVLDASEGTAARNLGIAAEAAERPHYTWRAPQKPEGGRRISIGGRASEGGGRLRRYESEYVPTTPERPRNSLGDYSEGIQSVSVDAVRPTPPETLVVHKTVRLLPASSPSLSPTCTSTPTASLEASGAANAPTSGHSDTGAVYHAQNATAVPALFAVAERHVRCPPTELDPATLDADELCVICLDPLIEKPAMKLEKCSHMGHIDCMEEWFDRRPVCPICQTSLLSSQPTAVEACCDRHRYDLEAAAMSLPFV